MSSKMTQYVLLLAVPVCFSYRWISWYTVRGDRQPCASQGANLVE
jgi:hypothetical protein